MENIKVLLVYPKFILHISEILIDENFKGKEKIWKI